LRLFSFGGYGLALAALALAALALVVFRAYDSYPKKLRFTIILKLSSQHVEVNNPPNHPRIPLS